MKSHLTILLLGVSVCSSLLAQTSTPYNYGRILVADTKQEVDKTSKDAKESEATESTKKESSSEAGKEEKIGDYEWPYMFPVMGNVSTAKGYKLQLPFGVSVQYFYMGQKLVIPKVSISANDSEEYDVSDLVDLSPLTNKSGILSVRPNLWLFPFINIYAIAGFGHTNVEVPFNGIALPNKYIPVNKSIIIDQDGYMYGAGISVVGRVMSLFLNADLNHTNLKLENFTTPFPATVFSFRIGRNFQFKSGRSFAMWVGGMGQFLTANTAGQILVSELAPELADSAVELDAEKTANCELKGAKWVAKNDAYNDRECQKVARLADAAKGTAGSEIGYDLEKKLSAVWNMTIGGAFAFNERWGVRGEIGFLDKLGILIGFEYRLGID